MDQAQSTAAEYTEWTSLAPSSRDFAVVRRESAAQLQDFRCSPEYAALDAVWVAHLSAADVDAEHLALAAQLPHQLLRLYLLESGAFANAVPLVGQASESHAAPTMELEKLREAASDFLTLHPRQLAWTSSGDFASEVARVAVMRHEQHLAFQERAIDDGDLVVFDPYDLTARRARDAFHVFGRGVYLFGEARPYYLVTGGAGHKAIGIYAPGVDIFLEFRAGLSALAKPDSLATVMAFALRRLILHYGDYQAAMRTREQDLPEKKLTLIVGAADNYAHHLWNFYPGLERLVAAGAQERVDRVISFGTEFYGSLGEIFPEISTRHVHREKPGLFDCGVFDVTELPLQFGGYFISRALRNRVLDAARRRGSQPEALGSPVVWWGLRVGSRSWVDQEQGIVQTMRAVFEHHPDATFVLDGYSFPAGTDTVSEKWHGSLLQLQALADRIAQAAPAGARVVNLVGEDLGLASLIAEQVDVYVAPIGTTQHKVGWFGADGVVYSGGGIARTPEPRRPGAWEAEGMRVPHYLLGSTVSSGERRSRRDRRSNLENVQLDGEALTSLVLSLLSGRAAAPSSAPEA